MHCKSAKTLDMCKDFARSRATTCRQLRMSLLCAPRGGGGAANRTAGEAVGGNNCMSANACASANACVRSRAFVRARRRPC
eukprot:6187717-Pleurochrysis_carterae.AAC.1